MKTSQIIESFYNVLSSKIFPDKRIPLSMYWIITERCCNNCRYCNYKNTVNSEELMAQELSTEQIKKILADMSKMGCKKIQFTGGEPLLRSDIVEILKQAKECGMYVGMSTSGIGLNRYPDIYKYLDMVFISLDGSAEIHNQTRNGNFFEHAIKAIDFFKNKGVKVFTTAVLTKLNIKSIDWSFQFAKDNNIICNFVPLNIQENVANIHIPKSQQIGNLLLTDQELKDALRYMKNKKSDGYSIGNTSEYLQYLIDWDDYSMRYRPEKVKDITCYAGKFFGYLFPNGDLYACGDLYWRETPCNAAKEGFVKAFSSLLKPKCQACLNACYVEQNLVYSLKWHSIYEWGMDKLKGKW